jgi:hypothetical protein
MGGNAPAELPLQPLLLPYACDPRKWPEEDRESLMRFPLLNHFALNILSLTKHAEIIGNAQNQLFSIVFNHLTA